MSPSAGDCWYHIPSPAKQKLKQVSVGRTSVYTVDENGKETIFVFTSYVYLISPHLKMLLRNFIFLGRLSLIMSLVWLFVVQVTYGTGRV